MLILKAYSIFIYHEIFPTAWLSMNNKGDRERHCKQKWGKVDLDKAESLPLLFMKGKS